MTFKELHQQKESLLICNVWDVASAKLAEKLGFQAIGTSSAAIATIHGLEDGENLSFQALLRVVESITANISIPLTVDIEAGYSRDPQQITDNIRALIEAGSVAINIEDSIVNKERSLVEPIKFSEILSQIIKQLADQRIDAFINVRTDTFWLS